MDPMSRPNVLFVICDQLRADHLGFAGNQVVRTPHIDAIAAGGTGFLGFILGYGGDERFYSRDAIQ